MTKKIKIAIDTMGSDNAPEAQLAGAEMMLQENQRNNIFFYLYGDIKSIEPIISKFDLLQNNSKIIQSETFISPSEKPSKAIRKGRKSSMGMAIQSVANQETDAVISAGNTGALMALSKIILKSLPTIDRPAIITRFPSITGDCIMLDLGANIECNADNLFQFAIMGDVYAKSIMNIKNPRIGLLNIGSEDLKGKEEIQIAANMLKSANIPLNFTGFVEGNEIMNDKVDIIVTDGFTGNVALKTIEGTAKVLTSLMKDAFQSSITSKIGALLSKRSLKSIGHRIDPRRHNGAMLIGLNGISVKSHGSADKVAFLNALQVTYDLVHNNINERITNGVAEFKKSDEEPELSKQSN
ncbi:MAG: phosphate acyltransferase PlsX [Pseudomonadota bacterium]